MKLFGKRKETKACCYGENCTSEAMQNAENKKRQPKQQYLSCN